MGGSGFAGFVEVLASWPKGSKHGTQQQVRDGALFTKIGALTLLLYDSGTQKSFHRRQAMS